MQKNKPKIKLLGGSDDPDDKSFKTRSRDLAVAGGVGAVIDEVGDAAYNWAMDFFGFSPTKADSEQVEQFLTILKNRGKGVVTGTVADILVRTTFASLHREVGAQYNSFDPKLTLMLVKYTLDNIQDIDPVQATPFLGGGRG